MKCCFLTRETLDVDTHARTHEHSSLRGPPQSGICYRTHVFAVCGDVVTAQQVTCECFTGAGEVQNVYELE